MIWNKNVPMWLSALGFTLLVGCGGGGGGHGSSQVKVPEDPPQEQENPEEPPPVAAACEFKAPGVMRIDTENGAPILDKDNYVPATLTIEAIDDLPAITLDTGIRGRGNSTWGMPKKPYRLKLDKKNSVFDMPENKDWAMLANYADKSMLRNAVTLCLGEIFEMRYVPRSRFAELTLNGTFQGLYQITEHIKTGAHRVDIGEEDEDLDNGFLVELDTRLDGDYPFTTSQGIPFIIKSDATTDQAAVVQAYIQDFETALFSTDFADPVNGYAQYVDVDSVVDFLVINEFVRNNDAMYFSSYMYKPRDGKLIFGPLWDFDLAIGNNSYDDGLNPEGFWVSESHYMGRFLEDPAFAAKVRARWQELRPRLPQLIAYIELGGSTLAEAAGRNFDLWDILSTSTWPFGPVNYTYEGEINYLKDWLTQRAEWLDTQWGAQQG